MKFHGSLQFPRLNAKKNNGPILHFALRKLEKLNQGNFLLAGWVSAENYAIYCCT